MLTLDHHFTDSLEGHVFIGRSESDHSNPIQSTLLWDCNNVDGYVYDYRGDNAEFHGREVYEMFGVNFLNHPDLRLLILPDGWEGKNRLRKDFEDPINMIRL